MGLYQSLINYLGADEAGSDPAVLEGLNDIQKAMVTEYAESESMTLQQAREHLHL